MRRTAALKVAQTITAGRTDVPDLRPGEAARIMSGTLVPRGGDRVVVQEAATIDGETVRLRVQAGAKSHIRWAGEDVAKGEACKPELGSVPARCRS